jgi:hypothetical protein
MFRVAYTRLAHDVISDTGAPDVIPATSVIRVTGAVRNVPAVAHTVWLDTNTINDTCAIHTAHAVHFPSDVAATRATDSAHPRCHATASRRRTNHYAGTAHTPDDNVGARLVYSSPSPSRVFYRFPASNRRDKYRTGKPRKPFGLSISPILLCLF